MSWGRFCFESSADFDFFCFRFLSFEVLHSEPRFEPAEVVAAESLLILLCILARTLACNLWTLACNLWVRFRLDLVEPWWISLPEIDFSSSSSSSLPLCLYLGIVGMNVCVVCLTLKWRLKFIRLRSDWCWWAFIICLIIIIFICLYFCPVWPQEAGDSWRTYSDIEAVNICASLSGVMPGLDPFAFLLE